MLWPPNTAVITMEVQRSTVSDMSDLLQLQEAAVA